MDLRHRLYEAAAQTPELDVEILDRIFRARARRAAVTLREDFCGTARLSAAWVGSDDDREALGVDVDPRVLRYAQEHRRALEDDAERMQLAERDVRTPSDRTYDVITAMNFSWALFDDEELGAYLASAAACLEDDGMLVLELFGGPSLTELGTREHRIEADGLAFTYLWEQRAFDPARAILEARIHFRLDEGRVLRDAFAYRFHLRPLDALTRMLAATGLTEPALYVESARGRYRRTRTEPRAPLWRGLLVTARR
jgi:hypothetical protein